MIVPGAYERGIFGDLMLPGIACGVRKIIDKSVPMNMKKFPHDIWTVGMKRICGAHLHWSSISGDT